MNAWDDWFASIGDKIVDRGGPCSAGSEITPTGTKDLPLDNEAITGYMIIAADNMDEAEKVVCDCPIITNIRVYNAMSM